MADNVITDNEAKVPSFTPERLAELAKYEKGMIKRRTKSRAWYAANKEAIHKAYKNNGTKEQKHEYYEKNKEKLLASAKARYAAMKAALEAAKPKPDTVGNIIAPGILDAFRGRKAQESKEGDSLPENSLPAQ